MMEDFSGLALPPLFGGHILEAELEPGGVELEPGEVELDPDPGGSELLESTAQEDEEMRALDKRKCLALSRRCKEIEQVCLWVTLNPLPERISFEMWISSQVALQRHSTLFKTQFLGMMLKGLFKHFLLYSFVPQVLCLLLCFES
ncbi:hypothetical protein ATANTOWER_009728 [Ataeniobius toweri]|uniref:Uncharacterized protein n=1 Tax=Ataeniobius toweri TaxID=208326 RepID=A0ABU7A697_9TELE|nr:hypothetical protein [Ataeniobius toweri]